MADRVHTTGGICQGNAPFPICSPRNIQTTLTLFMEGSYFNADLSSGKCQSYITFTTVIPYRPTMLWPTKYILVGNGVFIRAETRFFDALLPIPPLHCAGPGTTATSLSAVSSPDTGTPAG
ncbi:MAG TPA: hypothetical protein EYP34_08095, partial [Chromatiaceae bacterium]|nr:hypothetical protein [Chromatiaceae bacterium]